MGAKIKALQKRRVWGKNFVLNILLIYREIGRKQLKYCITVFIVLIISSCAAPGAPTIRTSPNDGMGPMVEGCNNILPPRQLTTYVTAFYHTTWGSAWMEGAQSGLRLGLKGEENERKWVQFEKKFAYDIMMSTFGLDGRHPPFPPFCTTFRTSTDTIDRALKRILPLLGNEVKSADKRVGLYGTELMDRAHTGAKWRDRYIITVQKSKSKLSVVTVYREIFISRGGTEFEMAISDGHNETWILAQISEETDASIGGQ